MGWLGAIARVDRDLPAGIFIARLARFPCGAGWSLSPAAFRAIAGVNAAVVGLLAAAFYDPVWKSAVSDWVDVGNRTHRIRRADDFACPGSDRRCLVRGGRGAARLIVLRVACAAMTPERWQEVKTVWQEAMSLDANGRAALAGSRRRILTASCEPKSNRCSRQTMARTTSS